MTNRLACATVALCAAALAAPALAQSPAGDSDTTTVSTVVKYRVPELTTARGAKAVALRIEHAANSVCGGDSIIDRQAVTFDACRDDAIDGALETLNAPMVSAALGRLPAPRSLAAR
jgi:UrcA family protein